VIKKLILVGAGPGDPELISLKGVKALQQANVVMYDALVSEELLQHAPNAIKLFCGKRAGTHYMKQDEINQKIVEQAKSAWCSGAFKRRRSVYLWSWTGRN
jgi:uroporphyrin-III C-methyltransferase